MLTSCANLFLLLKQELVHPVFVCMHVVVNSCCWQLFKQVQMKVLWSRCTSHLLSHLGSMIKAKKLKLPSMTISVEVLQEGKEEDSSSQEDQPI